MRIILAMTRRATGTTVIACESHNSHHCVYQEACGDKFPPLPLLSSELDCTVLTKRYYAIVHAAGPEY